MGEDNTDIGTETSWHTLPQAKLGLAELTEVEICKHWADAERRRQEMRNAMPRPASALVLQQAGYDVTDAESWSVISPRLGGSPIVWLSSSKPFHLAIRRGSNDTFHVYRPALPGFIDATRPPDLRGLTFLPEALFVELAALLRSCTPKKHG